MSTEHVIAKLTSHSMDFEIIVDAVKARDYKSGTISDIGDILVVDGIFRNLRKVKSLDKGMLFKDNKTIIHVEEKELRKIFGTTDFASITKKILQDGEIQYTTEQRKEFLERKEKAVINLIAGQSIDPRTSAPHTPARIEAAIKQAKAHIDIHRSAEAQVQNIVKEIAAIMPIKLEFKEIQIKVPVRYAGPLRKIMLDFGQIKKENWIGTDYIA
ncbi:MAG: ribosome assembly factor SBDS, partial [archaeon]|nr:ribosome assembly factor SBDS [archaeon]